MAETPELASDGGGPGRFDGIPGLVWYADVRTVRGDQLTPGMWLDSLDHRGVRSIAGIWFGATSLPSGDFLTDTGRLTVMFFGGDTETVRGDVEYDAVDPDSQVTPDGTPMGGHDA